MFESGAFYAIFAVSLLPVALILLFLALNRARHEVRRDEREFMDPLPLALRLVWPLVEFFAHYLGSLMRVEQVARGNRLLAQSGQGFMMNAQQFLGLQIVSALLFMAGAWLCMVMLDHPAGLWTGIAGLLGFSLPYLSAREKRKRRKVEILRQLPVFLDYLAMSIQAGANFTGAIRHAVDKGPDGPMKVELNKVMRDIRAGMGRFDALRLMAERVGVDPVHFAIIMSVNLTVGLATPPMGLVLFVASAVSGERVEAIARAILPFLAVEVLVIFLITYIPAISMTIPRLTGFVQ